MRQGQALSFWIFLGSVALLIAVLGWGFLDTTQEGFVYRGNPCGQQRDCRSCAAQAGCGWCGDLKECWPMAQDGFPMRVEQGMGPANVPAWVTDFTRQVPVCAPYRFVQEPERC